MSRSKGKNALDRLFEAVYYLWPSRDRPPESQGRGRCSWFSRQPFDAFIDHANGRRAVFVSFHVHPGSLGPRIDLVLGAGTAAWPLRRSESWRSTTTQLFRRSSHSSWATHTWLGPRRRAPMP